MVEKVGGLETELVGGGAPLSSLASALWQERARHLPREKEGARARLMAKGRKAEHVEEPVSNMCSISRRK